MHEEPKYYRNYYVNLCYAKSVNATENVIDKNAVDNSSFDAKSAGEEVNATDINAVGNFSFDAKSTDETVNVTADWVCDGTETYVFNVAGVFIDYKPICGDSIEILSKICALINDFGDDFSEWKTYKDNFTALNNCGLNDVKAVFSVPAVCGAIIDGDVNLTNLANRIYGSVNNEVKFKDMKLFSDAAQLTISNSSLLFSGITDIKNLMAQGLTLSELSEMLKTNIGKFKIETPVTLRSVAKLPAELVLSELKNRDFIEGLASSVSRFMLQGLRLPNINGDGTSALYKLTKQQSRLKAKDEDINSWICDISADETAVWLNGSTQLSFTHSMIPDITFNWTEAYNNIYEIEYFDKINRAYSISGGYICGKSAFHLFSDELINEFNNISSANVKYKNEDLTQSVRFGVMLKIDAEIQKDIILIKGLSPKDRLTLIGVLTALKEGSINPQYNIMYKLSSLKGQPDTLAQAADASAVIVKTNLSRETHMFANALRANNGERYIINFGTAEFLTTLWECSVVCGRYNLILKEDCISDMSENPYLWLFIQDVYEGNEWKQTLKPYDNCVMSGQTALIRGNEPITIYSASAEGGDYKPILAPGNYGINIETNNTLQNVTDDMELFSIISYKISGEDYIEELTAKESKPLIPTGDENSRKYSAVIPLYKNVIGTTDVNNPYNALGKKASLEISCRDVLGNYNSGGTITKEIIPIINDFMIGIHEWSTLTMSFEIIKNGDSACIKLNFISESEEAYVLTEESASVIKRSLYQLQTAEVSLNGGFFDTIILSKEQIDVIKDIGNEIIDKTQTNKFLLLNINPIGNIEKMPLSLKLTISRNGGKEDLPNQALTVSSLIRPNITAQAKQTNKLQLPNPSQTPPTQKASEEFTYDAEKNPSQTPPAQKASEEFTYDADNNSPQTPSIQITATKFAFDAENNPFLTSSAQKTAAEFAFDAENALGDIYKIAAADEKQTDLYIINLSLMLPKITVRPFERNSGNYPIFFGLRPISNKPVTRTAEISCLDGTGQLSSQKNLISYSNIDIDAWGNRFLSDLESLLGAEYICDLTALSSDTTERLIHTKANLAQAISQYLIPIDQEEQISGNISRPKIKDRLLKNLTEGSNISCTAEYDVSFDSFPSSNVFQQKKRIVLEIVNNDNNAGSFTIGECKIDIDNNSIHRAALLITALSEYSTGLNLNNLTAAVRDIEYEISEIRNGYETSKWLRFVIPVKTDSPTGQIYVEFSSAIPAPNPLRRVPNVLNISEQKSIADNLKPLWTHQIKCNCIAAEQDLHHFKILYSDSALQSHNSSKDLFDTLAQYDYIRSDLMKNISKIEYYKTFVKIAEEAASNWYPRVMARNEFAETATNITFDTQIKDDNVIITNSTSDKVTANDFVIAENICNFTINVKDLLIYDKNIAETSVQTLRNSKLLGNDHKVNEYFIYKTETSVMPKFPASLTIDTAIKVEGISGAVTIDSLKKVLSEISEALSLNLATNNTASLVVRYSYGLGGVLNLKTELPVAYFPHIKADLSDVTIPTAITQWYENMLPITNSAAFIFDLTVYNKLETRSILKAERIEADIKT